MSPWKATSPKVGDFTKEGDFTKRLRRGTLLWRATLRSKVISPNTVMLLRTAALLHR
jgi:hypothetical protein